MATSKGLDAILGNSSIGLVYFNLSLGNPSSAVFKTLRKQFPQEIKMVMKCILSVYLERIKYCAQLYSKFSPNGKLNSKGPYGNNKKGKFHHQAFRTSLRD